MITGFVCALLLVFVIGGHGTALAATRLTGIVYAIQGVDSGEIRLASKGKVYRLSFRQPFARTFSSGECDTVGAIWTVEADIRDDGNGSLLSAKCDGKRDEMIQVGALVISTFFNLVNNGDYKTAYSRFSDGFRSANALESFIGKIGQLKSPTKSLGYRCLEVERKISDSSVDLRAGKGCGISDAGQPSSPLLFHVEREKIFLQVVISSIEKAPE